MGFVKEFKEFAIKGNVTDMAIGFIIGAAFGRMVVSLINDVIMPPLGYIIGKVHFRELKFVLQDELKDSSGRVLQEAISIRYGNFIQTLLDFFLVAILIFVVIKIFNRLRKRSENEQDKETPTPRDIELLAEIRDQLKETNKS